MKTGSLENTSDIYIYIFKYLNLNPLICIIISFVNVPLLQVGYS